MRTLFTALGLSLTVAALACACSSKKKPGGDTGDTGETDPPVDVPRPPGPDGAHIASSDPAVAAPISLTAADGTGLALTRLEAKVVVDGPLSFTELHLDFRNPRPRQMEGRFSITLPEGATISRLAMQIGDRWQEAEVVERQQARQAYEDFLHRKQDPALLEKEAGNEFRARIFPIPANGEKKLIVSYSQPLIGPEASYRLPLRGLPRIASLRVSALVATGSANASAGAGAKVPLLSYQTSTMDERDFVPNKDFEVAVPAAITGLRTRGLDGGEVVAARVRPELQVADEKLAGLLILFDTSASRALGFSAQVDKLGTLVRELTARHGANTPLVVAGFDQAVSPLFSGTLGGFARPALDSLRARRALGASDLHGALVWAGKTAEGKGIRRALIITDGIPTAGLTDGGALRAQVSALKTHIDRLDMIVTGGIRDSEMAARLARGTLTRDGVALDGDLPVEVLARRISQTTVSGIQVAIADARWVWPRTLDGVQPGDEYLVFARMNPGALRPGVGAAASASSLTIGLSGGLSQSIAVPLTPVTEPLLVRATVHAEIARLTTMHGEVDATLADAQARQGKIKKEIIALSTRYRVLSDHTALLVLEAESDYARFGIKRQALADILTVGPSGVSLVHRNQPVFLAAKPTPIPTPPGEPRWRGRDDRPEEEDGDGASGDKVTTAAAAPSPEADPAAAAPPGDRPALVETGHGNSRPAPGKKKTSGAKSPAMEQTRNAGILGSIRADNGTAFASLTGSGDFESGLDDGKNRARRAPRGGDDAADSRTTASRPAPRPRPKPAPVLVPVPVPEKPEPVAVEDIPARRMPVVPPPGPTTPDGNRPNGQPSSGEFQDSAGFLSAPPPKPMGPAPLTGKLAEIMAAIKLGQAADALQRAQAWRSEQPGDLMALIALGESLEASGQPAEAARAYGSIIDLFPSRADMRRFAGERLERLTEHGIALAADSYAKSVEQRPDHMTGHRLLAMALVRQGRFAEAFNAAQTGLARNYPSGRFLGGKRILREDLGLIAAAWLRAQPKQRAVIMAGLKRAGATLSKKPSLRFVLTWETDANDVDFHIHDGKGGHAYYADRKLPSGGELYTDVTTGYGPECFTIPGKPSGFPYTLRLHYYSRGPMGFGMGKLEVLEHDGKGLLTFEQRPFVVMNDGAFVEVGRILPAK